MVVVAVTHLLPLSADLALDGHSRALKVHRDASLG